MKTQSQTSDMNVWREYMEKAGILNNQDGILRFSLYASEISECSQIIGQTNEHILMRYYILDRANSKRYDSFTTSFGMLDVLLPGVMNRLKLFLNSENLNIRREIGSLSKNFIVQPHVVCEIHWTSVMFVQNEENDYALVLNYMPYSNKASYSETSETIKSYGAIVGNIAGKPVLIVSVLANDVIIECCNPADNDYLLQVVQSICGHLIDACENSSNVSDELINAMDKLIELRRQNKDLIAQYKQYEKEESRLKEIIVEIAKKANIDNLKYKECKLYSYKQTYFDYNALKSEYPDWYQKYSKERTIYAVRTNGG